MIRGWLPLVTSDASQGGCPAMAEARTWFAGWSTVAAAERRARSRAAGWQTVRVMDRVAMRCEPAASVGSNGREMVG